MEAQKKGSQIGILLLMTGASKEAAPRQEERGAVRLRGIWVTAAATHTPPESGRGLPNVVADTLRWSAPAMLARARHCRGEETGASPRQLRLLAAAIPLAPRGAVELQHDVEIVGRWRRRTNVWRRITSPAT